MPDHLPATEARAFTPAAPKVIKRYTNRKLYDTVESRYVTLVEIGQMVKEGVEVQIIDNRTKEDLTSITLTQIIFEEEKKTSRMPLSILRDLIRGGGDKLALLAGEVNHRVSAIRAEADRLQRAVETVASLPTLHRAVQALRDKLEELEKKLAEPKE